MNKCFSVGICLLILILGMTTGAFASEEEDSTAGNVFDGALAGLSSLTNWRNNGDCQTYCTANPGARFWPQYCTYNGTRYSSCMGYGAALFGDGLKGTVKPE